MNSLFWPGEEALGPERDLTSLPTNADVELLQGFSLRSFDKLFCVRWPCEDFVADSLLSMNLFNHIITRSRCGRLTRLVIC